MARTILFMAMVFLPACSYLQPHDFGLLSPAPAQLRDIPQGTDSFSVGWRDGCNTYLGFVGSGFIQARGFTMDVNRSLNDKLYAMGYREGANTCTFYADTKPN